jgi:hypothetical protein
MTTTMEDLKDFIDLEEYALSDKKPPKNGRYLVTIDKIKYRVTVDSLTGRAILQLAGKNPAESFQLRQKLKGGNIRKIGLNDQVDLTEPGVEKFMTIPLDQTEG